LNAAIDEHRFRVEDGQSLALRSSRGHPAYVVEKLGWKKGCFSRDLVI
jgi:hypothetical protein